VLNTSIHSDPALGAGRNSLIITVPVPPHGVMLAATRVKLRGTAITSKICVVASKNKHVRRQIMKHPCRIG
jgi:hypothetical protein